MMTLLACLFGGLYFCIGSEKWMPIVSGKEEKSENGRTIIESKEAIKPSIIVEFAMNLSEHEMQNAIH